MESTSVRSKQDYARVLPQAALYDKTEAAELSQLVPPQSMTGDWKQIVNGLQLFGEYTSRIAEYAQAKNFEAARPLTVQATKAQQKFVAVAKHDGFKVCSVL